MDICASVPHTICGSGAEEGRAKGGNKVSRGAKWAEGGAKAGVGPP